MSIINKNVIKWIKNDIYFLNLISKYGKYQAKNIENNFGNYILQEYYSYNKNINNWSGILGEYLVKSLLEEKGINVYKPLKINTYLPDFETDDFIYEVKTRKYTTCGSIGDKILGVPYKYSDIPILYKKPLKIVLVAYQEYEAVNKFNIHNPESENKKKLIKIWKDMGIEFIKGSELI